MKQSACLVLFQTNGVLLRPWVILEVCTAVQSRVPIVALRIRGKGYDYGKTTKQLTFLDTELDRLNPGACATLLEHGVEPAVAAFTLSKVVPNIISIELDSSASENMLEATLKDVMEQMQKAQPVELEARLPAGTIWGCLGVWCRGRTSRWFPCTDCVADPSWCVVLRCIQVASKEEWLAARGSPHGVGSHGNDGSGGSAGVASTASNDAKEASHQKPRRSSTAGAVAISASAARARNKLLADLPRQLPTLPKGYVARKAVLEQARQLLLADDAPEAKTSAPAALLTVALIGMGGAGKTCAVTALARDKALRGFFECVCYVSLGQRPATRDLQVGCVGVRWAWRPRRSLPMLQVNVCTSPVFVHHQCFRCGPPRSLPWQRSLFHQLSGQQLRLVASTSQANEALRDAAAGRTVLLIVDDAWDANHAKQLSDFLDPKTKSRIVVTTRIQGLIAGAAEVALGKLPAQEAARLMLAVAGTDAAPPYSDEVLQIANVCGGLPLALAVAGGILGDQFDGEVTKNFVELMTAEHGEALRAGQYGDQHVVLEDALITTTLNGYVGGERQFIVKLFHMFAAFPEVRCASAPSSSLAADGLSGDTLVAPRC